MLITFRWYQKKFNNYIHNHKSLKYYLNICHDGNIPDKFYKFRKITVKNFDCTNKLKGNFIHTEHLSFGKNFSETISIPGYYSCPILGCTNVCLDKKKKLIESINSFKYEFPNVISLNLGNSFTEEPINILKDCFSNLTKLYFGNNFNRPITKLDGVFPNITILSFGNMFNQPIDTLKNNFPNLATLYFGDCFNQSINTLKDSFPDLTTLFFGDCFNQSVDVLKNNFPNLGK